MIIDQMWLFSKMVEAFLRTVYPLKKYDMLPSYSFVEHMFTCSTSVTPPSFFERVREGSIVPIKYSREFGFRESGLIVDDKVFLADVVVFATGYKPEQKLQNMFSSLDFKKCMTASSAPFYRSQYHTIDVF